MDEQTLRELIGHVKTGRLSRRTFVQTMISLGLTGPLAAQLLAPGATHAQPRPRASPRPVAAVAVRYVCSTGRPPPS